MNLVFTTACIAPDERMIHFLADSCHRFGIELRPYGTSADATYRGWVDIKIDQFEIAAQRFLDEGFTHCFYTDGRDSFMLTGAHEILEKYKASGQPQYLIACEDRCYPFSEFAERFPDPGHQWRWLGAGQFIGDLRYMLDMWRKLRPIYAAMPHENHDQGWLEMAYVDGHLDPKEFVLDTGCSIFQSMPTNTNGVEVHGSRIYNSVTNSWPCAVHWPGGYSDPETGKADRLGPVWKELGFDG